MRFSRRSRRSFLTMPIPLRWPMRSSKSSIRPSANDSAQRDHRGARPVRNRVGKPATRPDPAWSPLYAEYRTGGYHREFRVTDAIDPERIQAAIRDGVLELKLPKTERHRPRQISVQAS
ncbi:MAG: Hsp20/alpha crystallin family protein [Deltaproteobacteria bacterium]|nr:MAG: Hsp20/alpha crystallin family protein [Deltaproteobacteria bacterium]